MILFPNAKINLGLNVTSRRPDGYHELETVFYPVGWCDILEIIPGEGSTRLTVTGNRVDCPPEKNLVMKAVRQFEEARCATVAFDIHLHKVIPDGAGLGGGSSDAAFTLKGLNELTGSPFDDSQLAAMASRIGADCPFFIYNLPMAATGIGTTFSAVDIDLSGYRLVIVKPPVSVSTAEAYAGITPHPSNEKPCDILASPSEHWGRLHNDFEPSVFNRHRSLIAIKEQMYLLGAVYAAMSGSGSAIFGLFKAYGDRVGDRMTAAQFDAAVKKIFNGLSIHVELLR